MQIKWQKAHREVDWDGQWEGEKVVLHVWSEVEGRRQHSM